MEAYVWLDSIAMWLLKRAVRHIVEDEQDRYREEWIGDLAAMPNSLYKIAYALANFRKSTARSINTEYVAWVVAEFDEFVVGLSRSYDRTHSRVGTLRTRLGTLPPGREAKDIMLGVEQLERIDQKMVACINQVEHLRDYAKQTAVQLDSISATKAWVKDLTHRVEEYAEISTVILAEIASVDLDDSGEGGKVTSD